MLLKINANFNLVVDQYRASRGQEWKRFPDISNYYTLLILMYLNFKICPIGDLNLFAALSSIQCQTNYLFGLVIFYLLELRKPPISYNIFPLNKISFTHQNKLTKTSLDCILYKTDYIRSMIKHMRQNTLGVFVKGYENQD